MSLYEKLGKLGIPGFRSGTKWKMILASVIYLFVFLAIIPGLTDNQGKTKSTTIDSDKILNMSGKRIFPQVFHTICDPYNTNSSECAENLDRMSVFTADFLGHRLTNQPIYIMARMPFSTSIDSNPDHPKLFAYMQTDEPNNNVTQIPGLIKKYNDKKTADPNHIVIADDWRWLHNLEPLADVLTVDLYIKKNKYLPYMGNSFDNLTYYYEYVLARDVYEKNLENISRPVWNVIIAVSSTDEAGVLPLTQKELRNMVYSSITMDVKGLVYYSYAWSPMPSAVLKNNQTMTQWYIDQASEINMLNDVLVSPTIDYSWQFRKGTQVQFSNNPPRWNDYQQLNYMLKNYNNSYYLIVVNKDVSSLTTDISIDGVKFTNAEEIGFIQSGSNPRQIIVSNNAFTDTFAGQAVHIYKVN